MITRLAVLPYPPLLVPELTVRTDERLDQLRDACLRAVTSVTDAASRWVVVGVDRVRPGVFGPLSDGSFADYGVDVPVSLAAKRAAESSTVQERLPLPALVAGWLRGQVGVDRLTAHVLHPEVTAPDAASLARRIAADPDPVGLVVLSEGSRCRDERSPHPPRPGAVAVDSRIAAALAAADTAALDALDPAVLADVCVETVPALRFLAAAADAAGHGWSAELLYDEAPFGIAYQVAVWTAADNAVPNHGY